MPYIGVHKITNNHNKSTFPEWNRACGRDFFNNLNN